MFIEKLHHKVKLLLVVLSSNVVKDVKATNEVSCVFQYRSLISKALFGKLTQNDWELQDYTSYIR